MVECLISFNPSITFITAEGAESFEGFGQDHGLDCKQCSLPEFNHFIN